MSKRTRQYLGILSAVACYYLIHEGAHFLYALCAGGFREIHFMGLGVQIDVFAESMTDTQMGIFCISGSGATLAAAYLLVFLADRICKSDSKVFKACMYYITIAMLLLDPVYLSLLCGFFGGGDMNGISLLVPQTAARIGYGILLAVNGFVFWKAVLPVYRKGFSQKEKGQEDETANS